MAKTKLSKHTIHFFMKQGLIAIGRKQRREKTHSIKLEFPELLNGCDLGKIALLKRIFFGYNVYNSRICTYLVERFFKVENLNADLETLVLFDFTGGKPDLIRCGHLKTVRIFYKGHIQANKKLKKI